MDFTDFDYGALLQRLNVTGDELVLEILRLTKRLIDPKMSDQAFRDFKMNCLMHADVTKKQLALRLIKQAEESQGIVDVVALFSKTGGMDNLRGYLSSRPMDSLVAKAITQGAKHDKKRQAAHGGHAKSDKLQPVRDYCRKLYLEQPDNMKHQTKLKAIRGRVLEFATEQGKPQSFDQFLKTAGNWCDDLRQKK